MLRNAVVAWFGVLLVGSPMPAITAAGTARPTRAEVEQAVVASVPIWQGQKAIILKYLDLTQPFAALSPWTLVIAQDPGPSAEPELEDHGPIAICLVKALVPQCTGTSKVHPALGPAPSRFFQPYELFDAKVVYGGGGQTRPLLLIKTCSARGGDGNCNIETMLYQYWRSGDRFRRVFASSSGGSNNNQDARFVERGPLRGDVIVDHPTDDAPYAYWMEVYAPGKSGQYGRILRYRSITRYGDGNPLPVADSETPEILKRLGLWKPGDALPIPPHAPEGCAPLVMRHGEEWCKRLRIASPPQQ